MGRVVREDMPKSIMEDELEALLLPERSARIEVPQQENWIGLLRYFPKQSSKGAGMGPTSRAA